jgi:hypothetical protein
VKNLNIRDEVSLLFLGAQLCFEGRSGYDGAWQVAPLFCSIPYKRDCLERLKNLKDRLAKQFPELIEFGDARAARAFQSTRHSITKPSYVLRLSRYGASGQNQIENILRIADKEPASGGLVFSVFEAADLESRFRPGYVPCLVSGSFLLHENEFQMNAFFRSQSIIEFGLQDIMFLRQFQIETVAKVNDQCAKRAKPFEMGALNIHFGRIIIQRRLMRNKHGFVPRSQIVESWLRLVGDFVRESQFAA